MRSRRIIAIRERWRVAVRVFAGVVVLQGGAILHAQSVAQIRDSGPRSNRINVVILSEGDTSAELTTKFPADAQRIMDGMLEAEPYREYQNYFNFFTISVASQESGSDHPSFGIARNTYFNSSFETLGVDRLVTIPPNNFISNYEEGQGKVDQLLAQFVPDYDMIILLVNDERYGGSGGGRAAVVSTSTHSIAVAVHETGHTFADLGDEYDMHSPELVKAECPNVTQQTVRDLIKWRSWILPSTPVPTPEIYEYRNAVGLFEGANYSVSGWYRPKFERKMSVNSSPFCEVCAQAVTRTIYRYISHVDAVAPQSRKVSIDLGQSATFSVTKLQPAIHALSVQWFIDDVAVPGATADTFTVSEANASASRHIVRVDIVDATTLVRDDPQQLLKRSERWDVAIGPVEPLPAAPILNVSTRVAVQTGEGVLIGGFIVTGFQSRSG